MEMPPQREREERRALVVARPMRRVSGRSKEGPKAGGDLTQLKDPLGGNKAARRDAAAKRKRGTPPQRLEENFGVLRAPSAQSAWP